MKRNLLTIFSLVALVFSFSSQHSFAAGKEPFKVIGVADLSKLMTNTKPIYIYDANTDDTRASQGLITGAVPLASASGYDVQKTLPANKKSPVVFYCHSTS